MNRMNEIVPRANLFRFRQFTLGIRTALDYLELCFNLADREIAFYLRFDDAKRDLIVYPEVPGDLYLVAHGPIEFGFALHRVTIVFAKLGANLCLVLLFELIKVANR